MDIVMMRPTVMHVVLMAETVVGLVSIQNFALNVNATWETLVSCNKTKKY